MTDPLTLTSSVPSAKPLAPDLQAVFSNGAGELPGVGRARKKRGRWVKWVVGMALLGGVGGGAAYWFWPTAKLPVGITATVGKGDLVIAVTERGELESSQSVDVRCEVEGRQHKIVEILAEGTRVKKDDVVVKFDTEELRRDVQQQEVKYKQADGKAKAAREEVESAKNKAEGDIAKADLALKLAVLDRDKYIEGDYKVDIDEKKGDIALAERNLLEAIDKLEQYRKFERNGFGTEDVLRVKETEVEQLKYQLTSKKAKLEVLEKFTRQRQEAELTAKAKDAERELVRTKAIAAATISKAESEKEAADVTASLEQNALEKLQKQLEKCIVKAPQDGLVVYSKDRYWDPSSRVQPGAVVYFQQTLFTLPDLSKMRVKVRIHEAMIKKVKIGQKAEIRVEANPGKVLHGEVLKVSTLADNSPWDERGVKEYVTEVSITDLPEEAGMKPGMTAEVKVFAKTIEDVLLVPVQAVTEREGKHYGYVVKGSEVTKREVTVGENNEKFVEIQGGLEAGEQVALDARSRITAEAKAKEAEAGLKPGEATKEAPATPPASPAPQKPVAAR